MALKFIKILGVKISLVRPEQVVGLMERMIRSGKKYLITTPNPEIILLAGRDREFAGILNRAALALPDGIGLKFAALAKGVNLNRYAGADLTRELLTLAEQRSWPVAIINWHAGLSNKILLTKTLREHYPDLKFLVKDERRGDYVFDVSDLKNLQPKIIFSALGAPYQEKLLARLLPRISARIGIGVGGSFDYLTEQVRRAPKWLRYIGLEWLWRLVQAPRKRLRRIYRAVIIFPLVFCREELFGHLFYRPNVVGFLYQGDEVLLVNGEIGDKEDHWKLPQGGVEADEAKQEALMREMAEEIGTVDFEIRGRFDNINKYKWPQQRRSGFKGQKQTLFILRYNGDKRAIKLVDKENKDYKWVKIEEFVARSEPIRRRSYALFLKKFRELKTYDSD